mmetsp:Transcript_8223/g.6127  ORF Transcript_8223/g.6127 Transcript_8223/m.6127 type:complete len:104 (+) Transcript_8223:12-323(+)
MEGTKVFLEGKWSGKGLVVDKNFAYEEELTFNVVQTAPVILIAMQSFTWNAETKQKLHSETGFFKVLPVDSKDGGKEVEANMCHAFSLTEFEYGHFDNDKHIL